jgi:DNA-directed RNA polymerase specialized sigma24 family protein
MTDGKIDRNLYRYVVEALRRYPDDCARLQMLDEYISAPAGPDPDVAARGGKPVPQQDIVLNRQLQSAEFQQLEAKTRAMRMFLDGLRDDDYALVDLRYFRNLPWAVVADALHISEIACRTRRAPRIVIKAARTLFGKLA